MLRRIAAPRRAGNASALAGTVALLLLGLPPAVAAAEVTFALEPGVTVPLSTPQSDRFDVGGGQAVKAYFGLNRYLDIGPSASFLLLPGADQPTESGIVWGFGGGLRLKRPHDEESYSGISPWAGANALYVRTGGLDRPGFDAAVGLSVPMNESRSFWLGPVVRYLQVVQGERKGFDTDDARLLTIGIGLEVGTGRQRQVAQPEAIASRDVPCTSCLDSDGDGIPEVVDRCPDVPGIADNYGCPAYEKIIVKRDKLELKEKLYFSWNEAKLEEASYAVLDEVAVALNDNKEFRVQVGGHADSSGGYDHNQALSERRAEAVVDYLVAQGVQKDRLASKGFSSSVPRDTNATAAGRENNRRVEFIVYFTILDSGSAK